MGCGCGGKKKGNPSPTPAAKTTGAWTLTAPNGSTEFFDTRIQAQATNLRKYGGNGVVARTA